MHKLLFSNGDVLPSMGLGTWLSKSNEAYQATFDAIKIGYRHIDCAYIYRNEKEIGCAIRDAIAAGLVSREELFITSKLWNSDHTPDRVERAIRKSLSDLQLGYLDLYLIHWPVAYKSGREMANNASDLLSLYEMPISKTWQAMEKLKQLGLTKHIGVSNFNIPKLNSLFAHSQIKPEVNQIEIHPYFQQQQLVDFCSSNGVLVTAYSPLGSRHLINNEGSITQEKLILELAHKHKCTPVQILLAWGMQRGTSVIPKSVNVARLRENFEAVHVTLDAADKLEIDTLDKHLRITKGLFCVLPGGSYTLQNIWEE